MSFGFFKIGTAIKVSLKPAASAASAAARPLSVRTFRESKWLRVHFVPKYKIFVPFKVII